MNRFSHTPGPWKLAINKKASNFYYITAKDHTSETPRDLKIVSIEGGAHPVKEYGDRLEANAKLIAAAPELLEALRGFTEWDGINVHDKTRATVKALAAIQKATS